MVSFLQQTKLFRAFWSRRPAGPFRQRAYSFGLEPERVCAAFRGASPRLFQFWPGRPPARILAWMPLRVAWAREYLWPVEVGTALVWEHLQREQSWFVS